MDEDDDKLDWTCEYCNQTFVDGTGFCVVSDENDDVRDICEKCYKASREHADE